MDKVQSKKTIDEIIKGCNLCPGLNRKGVTENAPGYGDINSPIFIVGQSLGTDCMRTQIPFTGGSGKILDQVFKEIGIRKRDIFITNIVHCHPSDNRPSTKEEIKNCRAFLLMEFKLVSPKLIIALGRDAIEWALDSMFTGAIGRHVGAIHKRSSSVLERFVDVLPMYHPAYLYRNRSKDKETEYVKLMAKIIKEYL